MTLNTPILNGNKSWIVRLIMTAVITAMLSSAGWMLATASDRITRQEVDVQLLRVKKDLLCDINDLEARTVTKFENFENRTDKKFDAFEHRFNLAVSRIEKTMNNAVERIEKRIDK